MGESGLLPAVARSVAGAMTFAAVPRVGPRLYALRVFRCVLVPLRTVGFRSVMTGDPIRSMILRVRDRRQVCGVDATPMRASRSARAARRPMASVIKIGVVDQRGNHELVREAVSSYPTVVLADQPVPKPVDLPAPRPTSGLPRRAIGEGPEQGFGIASDPPNNVGVSVFPPSVQVLLTEAVTGVNASTIFNGTDSTRHAIRILDGPLIS